MQLETERLLIRDFVTEDWGSVHQYASNESVCRYTMWGPNTEQQLHRIYATCRPGNTASANVMRRIGMKQEGLLREHMWFKGQYHDSCLFSILKHEFQA